MAITSNDPDESTVYVSLQGTGKEVLGNIHLSPSRSHDFGTVVIGDTATWWNLAIENRGYFPLEVYDIVPSAGEFAVSSTAFTVGARNCESVKVTFAPISAGLRSATLTITSNDADEGAVYVSLQGIGKEIRIAGAEYFIDTDPGPGNGIALSAFDGAFDGVVEESQFFFVSEKLSSGLHALYARMRDSEGRWGPTKGYPFFVTMPPRNIRLPSLLVRPGRIVLIPMTLALEEDTTVSSGELTISYDSNAVRIFGISSLGTLSEGWAVEYGIHHGVDTSVDTAKISMATSTDTLSSGTLAFLQAMVSEDVSPGDSTALTFEWCRFDEGAVSPYMWDGKLSVVSAGGDVTWRNLMPGANVNAIADDGNYIWIGEIGGGLTRLSKTTGKMVFYDEANSGLPDNDVWSLARDARGNLWIGTYGGGLAQFDGTTWRVYDTGNSGVPSTTVLTLAVDAYEDIWVGTRDGGLAQFDREDWRVYNAGNSVLSDNWISALAADAQGSIWVGTRDGGLAQFDGEDWRVYDTGNSVLSDNWISALAADAQGSIWIGTRDGGLAQFDGEDWRAYNADNSGMPSTSVLALAVDAYEDIWVGTRDGGLAQFDGENWTVYNTDNSELPHDKIWSLAIDAQGNTWIGTSLGLTVCREGGILPPGILTVVEEESRSMEVPSICLLSQNYPNPFNLQTTIIYGVAEAGAVRLAVYALNGQRVRTLIDGEHCAGTYSVVWYGRDDTDRNVASGLYLCRMEADGYRAVRKMLLMK